MPATTTSTTHPTFWERAGRALDAHGPVVIAAIRQRVGLADPNRPLPAWPSSQQMLIDFYQSRADECAVLVASYAAERDAHLALLVELRKARDEDSALPARLLG